MGMISLSSVVTSVNHSMSTLPVHKGLTRVIDQNGSDVGGKRPTKISMFLAAGTVVAILLGWILLLSNAA